jgi:hypothetical protein
MFRNDYQMLGARMQRTLQRFLKKSSKLIALIVIFFAMQLTLIACNDLSVFLPTMRSQDHVESISLTDNGHFLIKFRTNRNSAIPLEIYVQQSDKTPANMLLTDIGSNDPLSFTRTQINLATAPSRSGIAPVIAEGVDSWEMPEAIDPNSYYLIEVRPRIAVNRSYKAYIVVARASLGVVEGTKVNMSDDRAVIQWEATDSALYYEIYSDALGTNLISTTTETSFEIKRSAGVLPNKVWIRAKLGSLKSKELTQVQISTSVDTLIEEPPVIAGAITDSTPPAAPSAPAFTQASSTNGNVEITFTPGSEADLSGHNIKLCTAANCVTGCVPAQSSISSPAVLSSVPDGSYFACIQSVDSSGNTSPYVATNASVIVDKTAPLIDIGANLFSTGPISITPSVNESGSGVASYSWSQISGPGTATFTPANDKDTVLNVDADGTFVMRLTVEDNLGNVGFDDLIYTRDTVLPLVNAGSDRITNATLSLTPAVSDIGSGIVSYAWTKVSGAGTVTFGTASSRDTIVTITSNGPHVLRLTVRDAAGNSASDDLIVTKDSLAPVVNVGADRSTNAAISLTPTVTESGSGIATYSWSRVSGPGTVTFGSSASKDSTMAFASDGAYILRLTVADNAGNSAFDDIAVTYNTAVPTVNVGADLITNTTVSLIPTVSSAGSIASYVWSKVSGPGTASFSAVSAKDSTIAVNADGVYVFQLTVTDNAGNTASDSFTLAKDTVAPAVNVGIDIFTGLTVSLTPSASDADSGIASYAWSRISGPAGLAFGDAAAKDTTVMTSSDGVYVLRLTVTDRAGNTTSDDLTLTKDTSTASISVGPDIIRSSTASVVPTVTANSGVVSYAWSMVSGPGSVTFGSPSAKDTTIAVDTDGVYVLRLTVVDNLANVLTDDLTLTKDSIAPSLTMGSNRYTNTSVSLSPAAADTGGSGIASYAWSQISGGGTATFSSPSTKNTSITLSADGAYTLRLTVIDSAGNTTSGDIVVTKDTGLPSVDAGADAISSSTIISTATASAASGIASYNWTMLVGPGVITFGTANALNTSIAASMDGAYSIRLTVIDNAGNSQSNDMLFIKDTGNPSVNVGVDQTSNMGITIVPTVTDSVSGVASYAWTQESGPGTIMFGSAVTKNTTAVASTDGAYTLRLTVTDNAGNSSSDDLIYYKSTAAPIVNVGADRVSNTTISITATASASSGIASYVWTKISGGGVVTFGSPAALNTTAVARTDDSYVLRLTVTDNAGNVGYDELTFDRDTVAPVISIGGNRLSNSTISLVPSASDAFSGIASYAWTQASGTPVITFSSPATKDTSVTASVDGSAVIRLTVTDRAGNSAHDELTFTRNTTVPIVNVGADHITNGNLSLLTSVTSANPIASYAWTKTSGIGMINFGSPSAMDSTVSASADDSYILRLTVTDSAGNGGYDELIYLKDTVAPIVSVGSNRLSSTTISVIPTVNDASSGIASYSWTKISGAPAITFSNPTAKDTDVTASVDGSAVIRLTVTDVAGNSAYDEFTYTRNTSVPVVDLGIDRASNSSLSLTPTVNASNAIASYAWTKVSGSGTISFGSPSAKDTTVAASADDTYVLRLTVTDVGGNVGYDDLTFRKDTVAPVVSVGGNRVSNTIISVVPTASDAFSGIASFSWTKVSGAPNVTFSAPSAKDTNVTASADGVVVIRLTVVDNAGNSSYSELTYTRSNSVPVVDVGVDRTTNTSLSLVPTVTADNATASYVWTKVSGTGTITFGSPSAKDTTVTASADDTYVLRLTVTDVAGNVGFDELTFRKDTVVPVVSVGGNRLSNTTISLTPTASDAFSGIATYAWTKVSGTPNVTFSDASALNTDVTASADGAVVLRLTVTDYAGNSAYSELTFTRSNAVPVVDVGVDRASKTTLSLVPSVSSTNAVASYVWTKMSGSGTITFGSPSAKDTTVAASADDTYVLRLTVTDVAGNVGFDELTFRKDTVVPVVSVGGNRLSNTTISMTPTASDAFTGIATYSWTKTSGIPGVTFSAASALNTDITASTDGSVVIRLTVTDNSGNSAYSEFTFTRNSSVPVVDVGIDRTSNTTLSLVPSVAAANSIASYAWTKTSGSGTITFGSPTAKDTTIAASADDTYVLRLTVTDVAGNVGFDEFTFRKDTVVPVVSVGANRLSNTTISLTPTASDAFSGIATYAWTKTSGTPNVTFSAASALNTDVTASADGAVTLRLTVTDNAGNSAYSELTFTRNSTVPVVNVGADRTSNTSVSIVPSVTTANTVATYAWTKISGSGTITFGSPSVKDTTIAASADDTYVLRLTVTDVAGNVGFDELTFRKDTVVPIVSVGGNRLSNTTISITPSASDAFSGVATYAWTKVSGTPSVTFSAASAANTDVTASADGAVVIRLTVTDNAGNSAYSELTFTRSSSVPVVNIGVDQTSNSSSAFFPTVTAANTVASYAWTQRSGSGTITFGNASAKDTTVTASADDSYVLRLTVTDVAGNVGFDEATFHKDTVAPVVSVGGSRLSNTTISVTPTASDAFSGIASYAWTKITGAPNVTFGTASALNTTVTASADGAVVIRLTVTDNAGNSAYDELTFTRSNSAPVVAVGVDRLSNTGVSVIPTVTSSNGVATYAWTKISGTGTITFGSPTAKDTSISASADGLFVLRLTVVDNAGNSAFDELTYERDTTAPTAPSSVGFNSTYSMTTSFNLAWAASTDTNAVSYRYKICSSNNCSTGCGAATTTTSLSATVTGTTGSTYYGCVQAYDTAPNSTAYVTSLNSITVDTSTPVFGGIASADVVGSWDDGSGKVKISLLQVPDARIKQYQVFFSLSSTFSSFNLSSPIATIDRGDAIFDSSTTDKDFLIRRPLAALVDGYYHVRYVTEPYIAADGNTVVSSLVSVLKDTPGYALIPRKYSGLAYDYYIMRYEASLSASGTNGGGDAVSSTEASITACSSKFHTSGTSSDASCGTRVITKAAVSASGATAAAQISWSGSYFACRNASSTNAKIRLPTTEEWRRAALYTDRNYAAMWTNFTNNSATQCRVNAGSAALTGVASDCKSALGVMDMAGNLREWVDNRMLPYSISSNSESRFSYGPTIGRTLPNGLDNIVNRYHTVNPAANGLALTLGADFKTPSPYAGQKQYGADVQNWTDPTLATQTDIGFRCVGFRADALPTPTQIALPDEPKFTLADVAVAGRVPEIFFAQDKQIEAVTTVITGNLTDSVASGRVDVSWKPWQKTVCNTSGSCTNTDVGLSYKIYRFVEPNRFSNRTTTTWALGVSGSAYAIDTPLDPLAVDASGDRIFDTLSTDGRLVTTVANCASSNPSSCVYSDLSTASGGSMEVNKVYNYMMVVEDFEGNAVVPMSQRYRSPYFAGPAIGSASSFRMEPRLRRASVFLEDEYHQNSRTRPQIMVRIPMDKSGQDHDYFIQKYEPAAYSGAAVNNSPVGSATWPLQTNAGAWVANAAMCYDIFNQTGQLDPTACGNGSQVNATTLTLQSKRNTTPLSSYDQGASWKACRQSDITDGDGSAYNLRMVTDSEWLSAADWGDTDHNGTIDAGMNPFTNVTSVAFLQTQSSADQTTIRCHIDNDPPNLVNTAQTGAGSTSNCYSRYGVENMIGNLYERTVGQQYATIGTDNGLDGLFYNRTTAPDTGYTIAGAGSSYDLLRALPVAAGQGSLINTTGESYFRGGTVLYGSRHGGWYGVGNTYGRWTHSIQQSPAQVEGAMGTRCSL